MLKSIIEGMAKKSFNEASPQYNARMIEIFNKAIRDELGAAISYKAMSEKVFGSGYSKLREELNQHATEEYGHFNDLISYAATHGILAKLSIDIDETVISDAPSAINGMIAFSQKLETDAISDYNDAAQFAFDNGDFETHEFFRGLVSAEQGHFDDIAVYTGEFRKFLTK